MHAGRAVSAFPVPTWSTNKSVLAGVITAVLIINLLLLRSVYGSSEEDEISKYINKCTTPLIDPPIYNPSDRFPTLVIYVYSEVDDVKKSNLAYFLKHGLCDVSQINCKNIDYAFVLNGETTVDIPVQENVRVYRRDNVCGDFGAWAHLFEQMSSETYKKYKRFMFINDTVRGPFVDGNYRFLLPKNLHFTDIFSSVITSETRLVGSYINCGGMSGAPGSGHAHVQTMSFMMDDVAMNLSLPIMKCYENKKLTIYEGEIGLSKNLIENNINIAGLLYAYRGIDFRCNEPYRYRCNGGLNPCVEKDYFGFTVNPIEAVFYKNSKGTQAFEATKLLSMYSSWYNVTE